MTRALIVSALLVALVGCRSRTVPPYAKIANSEAVKALRGDDSPYRIIYNPPVDLAKQPTPVTSAPASPRRE